MTGYNQRRTNGGYIERHKAARIITRDNHVCHVCGHAGADQVDHIIAWAEWQRTDLSPHDSINLAAIHGGACPVCGRQCHRDKSQAEAARGAARRAAKTRYPVRKHPGITD